jgi:hypothetical protein
MSIRQSVQPMAYWSIGAVSTEVFQ